MLTTLDAWRRGRACQEASWWPVVVVSRLILKDKELLVFRLERVSITPLVSGASNLLGEVSTAKDWGLQTWEWSFSWMQSAGIAMGSRRGLGKAKHVDTQYHWVQDRVAKRYFRLRKVDTGDMLADVLTKPVIEEKMNKALRNMNFHFLEGEHQPDTEGIDGLSRGLRVAVHIKNSPSSKHLDSPCLRTGSGGVIRYVYSIDHVTCSTYVCICAAAILVLLATFELTEWKGAEQCSGVFIRFKSPNSLFMCVYVCVCMCVRVLCFLFWSFASSPS